MYCLYFSSPVVRLHYLTLDGLALDLYLFKFLAEIGADLFDVFKGIVILGKGADIRQQGFKVLPDAVEVFCDDRRLCAADRREIAFGAVAFFSGVEGGSADLALFEFTHASMPP